MKSAMINLLNDIPNQLAKAGKFTVKLIAAVSLYQFH